MESKVFAIVVIHNGMQRNWIQKCFSGLESSTIPIRVIAVDNCSLDDSVANIKENFPGIDLIESKENLGFGKANNIGIKKAYDSGADYILLLNQDARIEHDTIQCLIKYHQKSKEYDIISPMHLDGKGEKLDYSFSIYVNSQNCKNLVSDLYLHQVKHHLYEITFVNAACWMLTRKCIETVGGFNPLFYHYGEDNNYLDRLHYHGLKAGLCPVARIYHDREQMNKTSYFSMEEIEKRNMLLKSLNPANPSYINFQLYLASRNSYYYLFTFRFGKAFRAYKQKQALKIFAGEARNNLKLSGQKGLTFLQENHVGGNSK